MSGALAGIRILEIVGLGPGPFAAMMLADHGAEVLRVHPIKPRAGVATVNTPADILARSRGSIALDLKAPEGQELLLSLIEKADGLIEGFRPGVAERLGFGPEAALARSPGLAYGRMTGWGQDGPLAPRAGHDINYIALTGALAAIGPAERPTPPLNLLGDFGGGGMMLAFGMLAAILSARSTGRGQVIDTAMVDGTHMLSAMIHGFRAGRGWEDAREANLLDGGAYFYGCYECACGGFMAVGSIEPQFHAMLLEGLGLDPAEFADQDSAALWPERKSRIAAAFRGESRAHWEAVFEGSDACVSPVLDWAEAQDHPHAAARGNFTDVDGIAHPTPAPRFSATPAPRPSAPRLPDQTGAETLEGWGLSAQTIAAAQDAGVLGAMRVD